MKNKLLTVLPAAEQFALYGLPDFDDGQRLAFLSLSEQELALACSRPGLHAQAYCALQIGYFKAKHAFFHFTWDDAADDVAFVLTRCFDGPALEPHAITKHEYYAQRTLIAQLFGYRLWSAECLPSLAQQAVQIVRRDVTPGFIVAELIAHLNEHKIVRPGYTETIRMSGVLALARATGVNWPSDASAEANQTGCWSGPVGGRRGRIRDCSGQGLAAWDQSDGMAARAGAEHLHAA